MNYKHTCEYCDSEEVEELVDECGCCILGYYCKEHWPKNELSTNCRQLVDS